MIELGSPGSAVRHFTLPTALHHGQQIWTELPTSYWLLTLTYLYLGELGSNPRALFICGINGVDSNGPAADVTFPLISNLRPERCLVDIGDDTISGIVEFNFILASGFEGLGELSLECTFLFHIMDGVSKYKFTERLSNKCLPM